MKLSAITKLAFEIRPLDSSQMGMLGAGAGGLIGTTGGAIAGAGLGALFAKPGNRMRNAGRGALLGGAGGLALGAGIGGLGMASAASSEMDKRLAGLVVEDQKEMGGRMMEHDFIRDLYQKAQQAPNGQLSEKLVADTPGWFSISGVKPEVINKVRQVRVDQLKEILSKRFAYDSKDRGKVMSDLPAFQGKAERLSKLDAMGQQVDPWPRQDMARRLAKAYQP